MNSHPNKLSSESIVTGILFAIFWASASVAGKFGLQSAEPLVLFTVRFLLAGVILLSYVLIVEKSRLPHHREWRQLTLFGILNTTLYLGLFVIALQFITPGITSLALALNPLFISILSAIWMRRIVNAREWFSIALGIGGVVIAAFPLFATSSASITGMILLALSMLAYSAGAVYYAAIPWSLSRIVINAWQVFIGGVLLAPFAFIFHQHENTFDFTFWASIAWLVVPVSIGAVQLWLRLLKRDAVRASMWLYLCPVFGFFYSNLLLDEPVTMFTFVGTALVMIALYVGQRKE